MYEVLLAAHRLLPRSSVFGIRLGSGMYTFLGEESAEERALKLTSADTKKGGICHLAGYPPFKD